jgi:hypothetical protein
LSEKIQTSLIQIFINPFKKQAAISFKEEFVNAKRVLILLPDACNASAIQEEIETILDALAGKEITLVSPGEAAKINPQKMMNQVNLKLNKLNLWTFSRSGTLKKLSTDSFDILIDLNESPNLLSILLSRKLNASVRVCMAPSQNLTSFNLIYNHNKAIPYTDKLRAYSAFIQQFIK